MNTVLSVTGVCMLLLSMNSMACTPEEATAKREQLAQEVAKITQQNPQRAKEINAELQGMQLDTASEDLPDKCQLIDKRLQELDQAGKKADS